MIYVAESERLQAFLSAVQHGLGAEHSPIVQVGVQSQVI